MDLYIRFKDRTVLVEVKPKKETSAPAKQGKTKQRYLTEAMTFVKNQNKWKAAADYAKDRGWDFEIWTEDELKALGILKAMKPKKKIAPLKKMAPYKRKKKSK
jgi:Holliday junction resolvase-like predicted endonuclease